MVVFISESFYSYVIYENLLNKLRKYYRLTYKLNMKYLYYEVNIVFSPYFCYMLDVRPLSSSEY